MTSYHFEVARESTFLSELSRSGETAYITLARDRAGRYHYEVKDNAMGWRVVISDRQSEWASQPWVGEYTQDAVRAQPQAAAALRPESPDFVKNYTIMEAQRMVKKLAKLDEAVRSAELLAPEVISINAEHLKCAVVRVIYEPRGLRDENSSQETVYWIDPQLKLVRKEHTIQRGRFTPTQPLAENTHDTVVVYTVMQVGTELPEALFRFKPPTGLRFVERFSPPGTNTGLLGQPAPPLKLKTLDGKEVSPDALRGKVLLVDFWATWCKPCLVQMPVVAKLHNELKDKGLVVVGVNRDLDPQVAAAYLEKNDYRWMNLYDAGLRAAELWGTTGIPTVVVVDRTGKIVLFKFGTSETDEADIRTALSKIDASFSR